MQPYPHQQFNARSNGLVSDYSANDLSGQLGLVTSNGNMSVEFFYAYIRIDAMAAADGIGTFKTRLCVRKRPHGDRHTEAVRFITEDQAMRQFPREFAFFKQNRDVPTDGTPLSELPGITQSQISLLVLHNIRCIEDLVGLSKDQVDQIGMDARTAHMVAVKWMEAKTSNAEVIRDAAKDAATNAELERLRASEAKNAATIAAMQAQLDLLTRMGVQPHANGAPPPISGTGDAMQVDADGMGEDAPPGDMFGGAQLVEGNDDLMDDATAPVSLPGLNKRSKR